MRADASANAGQGIGIARQSIGFFEPSFRNQPDVASGVGVRRASHHAGKVGVAANPHRPFVFESLQHDDFRAALSSEKRSRKKKNGGADARSIHCSPILLTCSA